MAIKRDEVVAAIHAGIRSASDTYRGWSLGWTLAQSGVEPLIVVEICRRLARKLAKAESLLLEVPYPTLIEWSGVSTVGRKPGTLKGLQRADIVLFNGKGRPTYAIEVKRGLTHAGMVQDLGRLRDAVAKCSNQKGGTLKRGFFAAYHEGRVANVERWVEDFNQADSGGKVSVTAAGKEKPWRVGDSRARSIALEIKAAKA